VGLAAWAKFIDRDLSCKRLLRLSVTEVGTNSPNFMRQNKKKISIGFKELRIKETEGTPCFVLSL
jgi:hypothetical protein